MTKYINNKQTMEDFEINKENGIGFIRIRTNEIKAYAFDDHRTFLECLAIPKGVSEIGDYAFKDCTRLTTVILPFSVNIIGKDAFNGCSSLAKIYVPANMVDYYKGRLDKGLHAKIAPVRKVKWVVAIRDILAKNGAPMHYMKILKEFIEQGYIGNYNNTPDNSMLSRLSSNETLFEQLGKGVYNLVGTSAPTPHSYKAVGGKVPVDVRPCALYGSDNPAYKKASSFIDSPVPSQDEKDLLELIVNFQLPLDKDKEEVCFADMLDKMEMEKVEFSNKDDKLDQDIDKDLLEEKLNELKKKIKKIERKAKQDQKDEALLAHMKSAAETAQDLLDKDSGDKVKFKVLRLGKFIPGKGEEKPKVVIYYENIHKIIKPHSPNFARWQVMAGVFVHEMFHAWNYFKAGQNSGSVLAIDEPMVEFESLYFLKELEAFTDSKDHCLRDEVQCVRSGMEVRVQKKQQEVGDLAAYGFGYYLYDNRSDAAESRDWIETYSKKSAKIQEKNPHVEDAKKALIPVYPFLPEEEAAVKKLFKKIIFNKRVIPASAENSDATKTGSYVSLRELVLACIETIGRKCFDAQELYAFAPIFKACMPHCSDLEDALKQQLDELVKDRILEDLTHDCYCVKLD